MEYVFGKHAGLGLGLFAPGMLASSRDKVQAQMTSLEAVHLHMALFTYTVQCAAVLPDTCRQSARAVSGLTGTQKCVHIPSTQTGSYHIFGHFPPNEVETRNKQNASVCTCLHATIINWIWMFRTSWLMDLMDYLMLLRNERGFTSCPSLSCRSLAWSVTVDRNSRRRWRVSLLHAGSR